MMKMIGGREREVVEIGPCTLINGDCLEVMGELEGVDAVISDPPFSAKTHDGHDSRAQHVARDGVQRALLGYASWSEKKVASVCERLPGKGWVCIITDHLLARDWDRYLRAIGRTVFYPLPVVVRGRNVRLSGDGPSSWTDWLVVARTKAESKWGTLPGFYEGSRGSIQHMGGKPLNAMCRIVEDYSRPGQTVLDFCMGAGTTGVACMLTGRRFIGIERDPDFFAKACARLRLEWEQGLFNLPNNYFLEPTQTQLF